MRNPSKKIRGDAKLLNLERRDVIGPDDAPFRAPGFVGERTYFFIALHGGAVGALHEDLEDMDWHSCEDVRKELEKHLGEPEQAWAKRNNEARLALIEEAERMIELDQELKPRKLASAPVLAELARRLRGTLGS